MSRKNFKSLLVVVVGVVVIGLVVFNLYSNSDNKNPPQSRSVNMVSQPVINMEKPVNYVNSGSYDYSNMTKSKLLNRISELNVLIDIWSSWDSKYEEAINQAKKEIEIVQMCLDNNNYLHPYSEEDFELLSFMIKVEAGSSNTKDEEQCLVGCVILNRREQGGINKDLTNPSIKDIINEDGQYGICKPVNGKNTRYIDVDSIDTSKVSDRHKENARKVLEHEITCPSNVVYQATFKQGSGVYKSFYNEYYNNTTYFCYE